MEFSPTYSPNKRVLLTKTKSPTMFWSKDLAKVDQIAKSSSNLHFASSHSFLHFPPIDEKKQEDEGSFYVGREVTGFLDLAPGFLFLDVPECELLTFKLPHNCTFEDLEARDKEVLEGLPLEFSDRLYLRRISILEGGEEGRLGELSVELQYFFGWT